MKNFHIFFTEEVSNKAAALLVFKENYDSLLNFAREFNLKHPFIFNEQEVKSLSNDLNEQIYMAVNTINLAYLSYILKKRYDVYLRERNKYKRKGLTEFKPENKGFTYYINDKQKTLTSIVDYVFNPNKVNNNIINVKRILIKLVILNEKEQNKEINYSLEKVEKRFQILLEFLSTRTNIDQKKFNISKINNALHNVTPELLNLYASTCKANESITKAS